MMSTDTAALQTSRTHVRITPTNKWIYWALALLPFLIVAAWYLADGPGLEADDYGQYLMHARALAEGHRYTDIIYIYSHYIPWIGPKAAPPGLPVMLAAIYKVAGPNIALMRVVMLCVSALFVLLSGLYFARKQDRYLGLGVTVLVGLSPAIAHASSQLLTDLAFAALIWATIYIVDNSKRFDAPQIIAITLLGLLAVSFRITGVALFPSFIAYAYLHRRSLGIRPAIPALIWLAGLAAIALRIDIHQAAVIRIHPQEIFRWIWETKFGLVNAWEYLPDVLDSQLHPFPWAPANHAFHLLTGACLLIGAADWVRKHSTEFATVFAVMYGGMLLLTPVHEPRYLWPLFPFFVFGVLNGVRIIALRLGPPIRLSAPAMALAFALVLAPPAVARVVLEPRRGDLFNVPEVQQVIWRMRRVAETSPVRVTFYKPRAFSWSSNIPAMGPIRGPTPCLLEELTRAEITHVIVGSIHKEGITRMKQLVAERPELFPIFYNTPHFTIYTFIPLTEPQRGTARQACQLAEQ